MSSIPAAEMPVDYCPAVSVIVPIYNGAADLPGLGDCLLQQTYPRDRVEYLLIDNNSQDDTAAQLQRFAQTAAAQGMTVRPLSEANIQSSYAARNQGIRVATGEILAFTDADCRPRPDWLARLVQPFQDDAIGLVVGEIKALPGHTNLERYAEYREM
ncbi:MAG: glycosyltransferase family 2 protein, partial [Leptolyngbya sp. RL_3_1]|nr:glycosyltransferase family 2 protein [Leptolyngbya sp. RL_3_1]